MDKKYDWETWKSFLFTAANILASAENQLQKNHRVSLSDFDVLATLYGSPEHTLSMNCLKATVLVTTSGLSRSVSRLEERGWVSKITDQNDRRQIHIRLTEPGLEAIKLISPPHRKFVKEIFFDALSAKDQAALGTALGHLRDHLND